MVLLFGANFGPTQLVSTSLQSFYGIGPAVCTRIMAKFSFYSMMRIEELRERDIKRLEAELTGMTLENALRKTLHENIERLRDTGTYRGRRHAMRLPVRGQGTRNNAQTAGKLNRVERRG